MRAPIDPATAITMELRWIKADSAAVPIVVRIGRPTPDPRGDAWACPCEIEGLDAPYPAIVGDSGIQAMALALRLVRSRLADTLRAGATLCLPGDPDHPLDLALLDTLLGVGPAST